MERYVFKIMSPRGNIGMDKSVLVQQKGCRYMIVFQVQESFSSIEHNTSQEFELFTSKSGQGSDSVYFFGSIPWISGFCTCSS